ncbi:MAG: Na+/H+ antiporter NhaC family protein, partial [Planctomycetota bacterium]
AALAAGLFLLPEPDPLRLAAMEVGSLLLEPGGDDPEQPLWRELVAGAAVVEVGDRTTLRLGEVSFSSASGPEEEPALIAEVRRSLRRTLRAVFAAEKLSFEIAGGTSPVAGGASLHARQTDGELELSVLLPEGRSVHSRREWSAPRTSSLFPPLIAILLAILLRRPVPALFAGVFTGAYLVIASAGGTVGAGVIGGLRNVFSGYLWNEIVDGDRQLIILFVVFMLSMVGVMTRSGGIRGLMDAIARVARDVRRTQIAAWLMGLAVFFDDYANTILVGSTMRPLTDRFKIAREKLAYIVDSTAAPVAGLSIFSTWIAFEVSTFSAQLPDVGFAVADGYRIFIETLPFRFYCIFTLIFVGMVVFSGRDFGPMLAAERRARKGRVIRQGGTPMIGVSATELEPAPCVTPRPGRAVLPILTFILVTMLWMAWKGGAFNPDANLLSIEGLGSVLGEGDVFRALMVGSAAGYVLACLMALKAGLRSDILSASFKSLRAMGIAFLILYLAWMIGAVCRDVGTAPYLTALVGDALNPLLLPVILFALAGVVAFSTGSSWSTMTILLPIVVGLAFGLGEQVSIGGHGLMVISIGAVLEGAIFGDHCSPISDTTVMSSIASASDHIDHVRTQSPYALLTMVIAMVVGYLPCTLLGWHPAVSLGAGTAVMALVLFKLGARVEASPAQGLT